MAMMITKFNKIIHNKTVWLFFAILISVAFVGVYTGSKSSGAIERSNSKSEVVGRLSGKDISRLEYNQAFQHVYVMYSMMTGRPLKITKEVEPMIRRATWLRIATLKKANEMGLTVSAVQVVDTIKRQPIFQNPQSGQYDASAYNAFVNNFLPSVRMNAKGLESMFAENVLIEKASNIAAQGALVTDEEIKKSFHLYSDKLTVDYAKIPRSLTGTITVSDEEAKVYFDQNPDQFRMPEKAIVHYVQFAISDYTNSVTVADEIVAQVYESNKQSYLKPAVEGAPEGAAPEYKTLEEVKDSIVAMVTPELARREAANVADALVAQLSDENATFQAKAEEAGLQVISNTPAFGVTDSVKGVDPTAPFARAAFNLQKGPSHYYSDPVVGRDFVYIIALQKKLPSFPPTFEMVKADALEMAKMAATETAYVEKAVAVHTEIQTAIKAGTSFADAATKYELTIVQTIPFDPSTSLKDEFGRQIMNATIPFESGTLVDLIDTPNELLVAYIAEKELADETTTLPAMREEISAGIRNKKANQLAQAWQESVLEEANLEDLSVKTEEDNA